VSAVLHEGGDGLAISLALLSLGVALSGLGLGWLFYAKQPELPGKMTGRIRGLYTLVLNKFKVDEFYDVSVVRPIVVSSQWLWRWVDTFFIDGMVNQVGKMTRLSGNLLGLMQSGNVQTYALFIVAGVVMLFVFFARGFWY